MIRNDSKQDKSVKEMRILGITGGIGSGKSEVLRILDSKEGVYILESDKLAHKLMQPGHTCYKRIVETFGTGILSQNESINRPALGELVFSDPAKLDQLNRIVHPAVKSRIRSRIRSAKKRGVRLFVIEAALLIQDGYRSICDELWYIHVDRELRIERLLLGRGGTREKWESVLQSQPKDAYFRENTDVTLENGGDIRDLEKRIDFELKRMLADS